MASMMVMAGPERRRRWSEDQKRSILAAADQPGASVAEVARRADVCTSLIYRWRQERREGAGFVPTVLFDDAPIETPGARTGPGTAIMVELPGGARVNIAACASADLVTATLRALR